MSPETPAQAVVSPSRPALSGSERLEVLKSPEWGGGGVEVRVCAVAEGSGDRCARSLARPRVGQKRPVRSPSLPPRGRAHHRCSA